MNSTKTPNPMLKHKSPKPKPKKTLKICSTLAKPKDWKHSPCQKQSVAPADAATCIHHTAKLTAHTKTSYTALTFLTSPSKALTNIPTPKALNTLNPKPP